MQDNVKKKLLKLYSKKHDELLKFDECQFSIISDILIRDGNAIIPKDQLVSLYEKELNGLKQKIKEFVPKFQTDKKDIDFYRKRDYLVYYNCVKTSYEKYS